MSTGEMDVTGHGGDTDDDCTLDLLEMAAGHPKMLYIIKRVKNHLISDTSSLAAQVAALEELLAEESTSKAVQGVQSKTSNEKFSDVRRRVRSNVDESSAHVEFLDSLDILNLGPEWGPRGSIRQCRKELISILERVTEKGDTLLDKLKVVQRLLPESTDKTTNIGPLSAATGVVGHTAATAICEATRPNNYDSDFLPNFDSTSDNPKGDTASVDSYGVREDHFSDQQGDHDNDSIAAKGSEVQSVKRRRLSGDYSAEETKIPCTPCITALNETATAVADSVVSNRVSDVQRGSNSSATAASAAACTPQGRWEPHWAATPSVTPTVGEESYRGEAAATVGERGGESNSDKESDVAGSAVGRTTHHGLVSPDAGDSPGYSKRSEHSAGSASVHVQPRNRTRRGKKKPPPVDWLARMRETLSSLKARTSGASVTSLLERELEVRQVLPLLSSMVQLLREKTTPEPPLAEGDSAVGSSSRRGAVNESPTFSGNSVIGADYEDEVSPHDDYAEAAAVEPHAAPANSQMSPADLKRAIEVFISGLSTACSELAKAPHNQTELRYLQQSALVLEQMETPDELIQPMVSLEGLLKTFGGIGRPSPL